MDTKTHFNSAVYTKYAVQPVPFPRVVFYYPVSVWAAARDRCAAMCDQTSQLKSDWMGHLDEWPGRLHFTWVVVRHGAPVGQYNGRVNRQPLYVVWVNPHKGASWHGAIWWINKWLAEVVPRNTVVVTFTFRVCSEAQRDAGNRWTKHCLSIHAIFTLLYKSVVYQWCSVGYQ